MDNLTHTLIGVLVGEAAAARAPEGSSGLTNLDRRKLFVPAMAIGSNLPDLDLLYTTFTGSKLDYLLHHRGHTHTFVGAIVLSALLWLGCQWWIKRRKLTLSRTDRLVLLGITLFAPVLHILMDLTNNYGVHPWWPLDNHWIYGDSVFIIEPLLWAACAPLVFVVQSRLARRLLLLILAAGVVLTFLTGMVPWPFAAVYTVAAIALALVGKRFSQSAAIATGIATWLTVTLVFVSGSRLAHARSEAISAQLFPNARLLDRVVTPMPVNPICWEVIFVHTETDVLVLRRSMLSLWPSVLPAGTCPDRSLDMPITASLEPVPAASDDDIQWHGQVRSQVAAITELWGENCQVEALMRFARAPWLAEVAGDLVMGDLRYDREPELGFADIKLGPNGERCPVFGAPWIPPRQDLLAPPSGSGQ